jgi:hypothetical protein
MGSRLECIGAGLRPSNARVTTDEATGINLPFYIDDNIAAFFEIPFIEHPPPETGSGTARENQGP